MFSYLAVTVCARLFLHDRHLCFPVWSRKKSDCRTPLESAWVPSSLRGTCEDNSEGGQRKSKEKMVHIYVHKQRRLLSSDSASESEPTGFIRHHFAACCNSLRVLEFQLRAHRSPQRRGARREKCFFSVTFKRSLFATRFSPFGANKQRHFYLFWAHLPHSSCTSCKKNLENVYIAEPVIEKIVEILAKKTF